MGNVDTSLVIRDVSDSLKATIQQNVEELKSDDAILFEAPGQFETGSKTCLSLYLYQLEYNPYLRNVPTQFTSTGQGSFASIRAPVVVDLRYLMAPYSASAETELVIIDKLTQLFYDQPLVNPTGSLSITDNTDISIVPDFQNANAVRDIWMNFSGNTYKLALYYLISPVRIPSALSKPTDRILQVQETPGSSVLIKN